MKLEDFFTPYALSCLDDTELRQMNNIIDKHDLNTATIDYNTYIGLGTITIKVESGNWKHILSRPVTELGKYRQKDHADILTKKELKEIFNENKI